MSCIYPISTRIPVKIGHIELTMGPLTAWQKNELSKCVKVKQGEIESDDFLMATLAIKYGVKDVKGLKTFDGSNYIPELDEDGSLSDTSVSEVMQMDGYKKLCAIALQFANKIHDPKIEGVKVVLPKGGATKNSKGQA